MGIGRRAWRIGLAALVLIFVAIASALRWAGPEWIRDALVSGLVRQAGVDLEVGAIDVSLLPPRVGARDVTLSRGGQRLFRARGAQFDLALSRSLWEGAWIGDITLDEPSIVLRDESAAWREIEGALRAPAAGSLGESRFLPRRLTVRSGEIDLQLSRAGLRIELADLFVEAKFGGLVRRRISFDTTARVAVERVGRRLELTRVALRGATAGADVRIDAGVIDGQAGSMRWAGTLQRGRLRGHFDSELALDPVFALAPEAGIVRGGGHIRGDLGGSTERPEVSADLEARGVRIGKVEFSGRGRLATKGDEWTLDRARAEIFGGEAEGTARGKLDMQVPFEATARFVRWNPARFVALFGTETPLRGAWSGEARAGGHLFGENDYHGEGRFTLEEGTSKLAGTASFAITQTSAEVDGSAEAGTDNRLRARYQVLDHRKISGSVEANAQRLALFGPFVGLELDGAGRTRAEFVGSVQVPLFKGEGEFAGLVVQGIHLGAVRGPFEISKEGARSAKLELADGRIQVSGRTALTATQQNEWTAAVRGVRLAEAVPLLRRRWPGVPELDGRLDGDVRASGPWTSLRFALRGQLVDASVAGEAVGNGPIEISRGEGRATGRCNFRRADGAVIALNGTIEPDGRIAASITAGGWRFEHFHDFHLGGRSLAGGLALQGTLGGSLTRPRGDLSLTLSDLDVSGHPLGTGVARLRTDGENATLDGNLGDKLRVSATATLSSAYPFLARAEWRDFDLAPVISAAPGVAIAASGDAELRGDVRQPFGQGSVRLTTLRVQRGVQRLENRTPIGFSIANGAVNIPDAELDGEGQHVVVGGRWTPAAADLHGSVNGDLELLESLSSAVASARGRVEADIHAVRHGDEPWRYRGTVKLSGGALDLAFLVGVTDLIGEVDFEERAVELRELKGKVGGGEFLVAGTMKLDVGWDLGWAIHDASLGVPSWLDYRASGNGRIAGAPGAPELTGEIEIAQAVYDRRIEWSEFLPWFRKQAGPSRSTASIPLAVDLHIAADGGLFVDNNLAKAELRSDLHVRGGRDTPLSWSGGLDVLSGEFVFRRRRFTITSGSVQFYEDRSTNPDLQFSGETRVATRDDEYQIQVRVTGTADNPRIQFSADDPTLTENDVLALVTFGRTVAQLQSQGAGIELSDVLALTTGPEAGKVEKQIHTLLPVDRIEIEPSFSRVNGVSEPRLSVAKDLAERLSAVIGTGLGSERRQDVGLEYQLTRRFSLQGIWESQTKSDAGTFGGNLKFRVPFRTLPRFSLLPRSSPSRLPGEP